MSISKLHYSRLAQIISESPAPPECNSIEVRNCEISKAVTANGTCLTILGIAEIPLLIAGCDFCIPMYVTANLDRDLILGTQFLIEQNASMHFTSNSPRLNDKHRICTTSGLKIPPRTQTMFEARVKTNSPSG